MDRIQFKVNGEPCSVGSEIDSDVSVNDYVRNYLNLRGTKYMCKEGGCGSCIVAATAPDPYSGGRRTISINSCLVSITSCQDWEITTIEGIGGRRQGYHPVQRTLAEYNGTQCGYCSPGWVVAMYSLLEANLYDLTKYEIENAFGSNVCRCTGYRPILDAFKSFAKDAPKPKKTNSIDDIEDLKICKEKCNEPCKGIDWCMVNKDDVKPKNKKIHLKDDRIWYRVHEIADILDIFEKEGNDYMLVNGNTGRGAYHIFAFPRVLIDISPVLELRTHVIDQNLVLGAGTTLTDAIVLFRALAQEEEFSYLDKFSDHLELVAHIPVRNVGTIAGNLMVKHRTPVFPSDVFLLFESVGATLTIVNKDGAVEVSPAEFLTLDMSCRIITEVKLPPLSKHYQFVSFKVMPRAQSAHAQVNTAFLYEMERDGETVRCARIVIGGLSPVFVHARETEKYLVGKNLFRDEVLQNALRVLEQEMIVQEEAAEMAPEFRKKCALGLFYKGLLTLIPPSRLNPRFLSGRRDYRKTRPLSSGQQKFDTNPLTWPITEPMPKVEALIQCAGEAKYVNDIPTQPREVFCAFVTSDICTGEILEIDPSPALKLPGVLSFFSAKDIPGTNNALPPEVPTYLTGEEIFCDGRIKYYDQAIGVIVAETEVLANRAALLVHIKYKKDKTKPVITITDAIKDPGRVDVFFVFPARARGKNVTKVIKDYNELSWQIHFTMETIQTVTRASDDGMDVFPSTQWLDAIQVTIAKTLKIEQNRINVDQYRCGGAYGLKISRPNASAAACALVTHYTGRACRFALGMQASFKVIGKRPPVKTVFEVGTNDDGEIQYLEYHLYEDQGYVFTDQMVLLIPPALKNCYDNQRWAYKIFNVTTDTASNTWARSPGNFEAVSMTEQIMEEISYKLQRDPIQVRRANLNPQYPEVEELLDKLLEEADYKGRRSEVDGFNKRNRWKKRGLRVTLMSWPVPIVPGHQVYLAVLHGDGTVIVKHGGAEIGQGLNTRVMQVVAYTLNIPMKKVIIKPNDAAGNANTFTTGGSRTNESIAFGAIKCCQLLLDRLQAVREAIGPVPWEDLIQAAYLRGINLTTSYHTTSNDQVDYRVAGVALAEVEVDILTGEHLILRVDIHEDVGTSVNPELDIGQIEGAFTMGVGQWTSEHVIYDEKSGELLTDRTWFYHVPGAKDIPLDLRVRLRSHSYNPLSTLGARAVGEPATCLSLCVPLAVREAIMDSRFETGYPRTDWFHVNGAFTLEAIVLSADTKLEEFKYK